MSLVEKGRAGKRETRQRFARETFLARGARGVIK